MRTSFIAVAGVLVLSACGDLFGPSSGQRAELRRAEARWEAADRSSYVVSVARICFCIEVDPREVRVMNGVVTDVRHAESGVTELPEDWQWYPSVEQLFAIIRDAIDDAAALEVTYDAELGYPTEVDIDWDAGTADDEVTFRMTMLPLEAAARADR